VELEKYDDTITTSHRREAIKAFTFNLELQDLSGRGSYYVIVVRKPTGAPTPEEPPLSATTTELYDKYLNFHGSL
jgi:hypothetical protein